MDELGICAGEHSTFQTDGLPLRKRIRNAERGRKISSRSEAEDVQSALRLS